MSDLSSPPAARLRPARWLDARLVVGALLVLVSVAVGARLLSAADDTARVWAATRALPAGSTLSADDLTVREVRLAGIAARYLDGGGTSPAGFVLTREVGRDELVPAAAVVRAEDAAPTRVVTVPVDQFHFPTGLGRGERVDVYVTPEGPAGRSTAVRPRLVLRAGTVAEVEGSGGRLGSSTRAVGVGLSVPADRAVDVVRAVEQGPIDLVRVPPGQQP